MEKLLEQIADRIRGLDEASLTQLLPKYKQLMDDFQPTEEWERAVIIFFLINSVRVKNTIFNDNVLEKNKKKSKPSKKRPLKLVKTDD